jgi:DNA-binding IclR family transcriptional regulator
MIHGAIEVLACGASEISRAAQKALMASTLCWNPAATPNTVTAIPALLRQFTAIRQCGYAVDHEENEIGSVCVATAIRGLDGRPVGALSISGPSGRVDDQLVKVIGAELVAICGSLSDVFQLGGAARPRSVQLSAYGL